MHSYNVAMMHFQILLNNFKDRELLAVLAIPSTITMVDPKTTMANLQAACHNRRTIHIYDKRDMPIKYEGIVIAKNWRVLLAHVWRGSDGKIGFVSRLMKGY